MRGTPKERFWAKVDVRGTEECWVWTGAKTSHGYGTLTIEGKTERVHRLAFEWAIGPIPKGMCVCHLCDNRACVNPAHLFLGSVGDNNRDCWDKGRHPRFPDSRGENNGNAKLTARKVARIREAYAKGDVLLSDLASRFDVSARHVWRIINYESWATS